MTRHIYPCEHEECQALECLRDIRRMIDSVERNSEDFVLLVQNAQLPAGRVRDSQVDDILLLSRLAIEEYQERRRRSKYFDVDLFGEPAWDMLLDLFVAGAVERRLSVTALCYGSGSSQTTALRWLGVLESKGLVGRSADKLDKRRVWVMLTKQGDLAVRSYLLERAKRKYGDQITSGLIARRAKQVPSGAD